MEAVAVLIVVAVLALPLLAEALRRPVTRALQQRAPGGIAQLPGGRTHYRWSGRAGDPVAVCVHGLSTPSYVFAATERSLVSLGFRVLTYDLYGRGFSDRVSGAQDAAFFTRQLAALLADQEVTEPVTLLGFSMGGQIAARFAAQEPDRVERLVLVAPAGLSGAGPDASPPHWTAPLIGDWWTRVWGGVALRRELVEHRSVATVIPDFEDRQAAETRTRGYLPAILSSRRHLLRMSSAEDHARIAKDGIPVLAIWGAADPVIPKRSIGELARLNPGASHVEIKGAGHTLLQTHPSEVAAALRNFLWR